MINFQYIKWRNFLSTGNQFTEVQLNRSTTTLLVGSNGHGKSTIVDAICYALFNKAFRNVNLGQLINSINRKECEVEIGFNIGTKNYVVKRGQKPKKFEIWIDGELKEQNAENVDYQEFLEKNIIKLNFKNFTQIAILGAANYTPFMQLKAADRREVIEDLLDINVFTKMNDILKLKNKTHNEETVEANRELEYAQLKVETQQKYIDTIKKNNKDRVVQIDESIEECNRNITIATKTIEKLRLQLDETVDPEIEVIQASIDKKNEKLSKLKAVYKQLVQARADYSKELLKPVECEEDEKLKKFNEQYEQLSQARADYSKELLKPVESADIDSLNLLIQTNHKKISDIEGDGKDLTRSIREAQKEVDFFDENETCPTCTQPIDSKFKQTKVDNLKNSILEWKDIISKNEEIIDTLMGDVVSSQQKIKDIKQKLDDERKLKLKKYDDEINVVKSDIADTKQKIKDIKDKLDEKWKIEIKKYDDAITDATGRIESTEESIASLVKEQKEKMNALDHVKSKIKNEIQTNENSISVENSSIKRQLNEKNEILSNGGDLEVEVAKLKDLDDNVHCVEKLINDLHEKKKYIDAALTILKDNGIKTMVIKQYVPVINKLVNSYLQIQDLFVQFELDETFNEVIRSRHRDDFSYASFSEGEKARIDISILLTFRAIAKMKSTSSTNLLLLDETFDSSIDADGADALAGILGTLADTHVFCISHNEKMFDKFRSVVKFVKINNYSVIK